MRSREFEVTHTDEEWRRLLSPEQYRVIRAHGTELAGSCALIIVKDKRSSRKELFDVSNCVSIRADSQGKNFVIDLCPQANASSMLLGGITKGEEHLVAIASSNPRRSIAGYINQRVRSPSPKVGAGYASHVHKLNKAIRENLYLVVGDEELEVQTSRVSHATNPGPDDENVVP